MKAPLILTIVFFVISSLNAQMCPCDFKSSGSEKSLRNEIGANLINISEVLINFTSPKAVYLHNYAKGFMLKHHFNTFSIRAGFDYNENTYRYEAGGAGNYNLNNGKSYGKDFRIGAEKTIFDKKLQAYGAADMLVSTGHYTGMSEGYGDLLPAYKTSYAFNSIAYGISPAVGIKYRPLRRFSITLETSISILYYKTSSSRAYKSESSTALLSNPLRVLSFNYHF